MIDDFAVNLAVEYLERSFANSQPADLVGMLDHVDYYERVVMVREEVQEVMDRCPSLYLQRVHGRVIFTKLPGDREITDEDMKRNVQIKKNEFWAKYQRLHSSDDQTPGE